MTAGLTTARAAGLTAARAEGATTGGATPAGAATACICLGALDKYRFGFCAETWTGRATAKTKATYMVVESLDI